MSKLTLRIRLVRKINSGFRIVFNMRFGNILQAHGNNSVHGIHLPIACVFCSIGPRNGRNQMGKMAALLVKSGTPEQHHSGTPEHQKFLIC